MPLGWIRVKEHKEMIARERARARRDMSRLNERHQEEIRGLRNMLSKSDIIKARGQPPTDFDSRYTIQVFADANLLHQAVRGNEKQMVEILSQQFMHEARQMLLALSGLEKIPVVPTYPESLDDWYKVDKR